MAAFRQCICSRRPAVVGRKKPLRDSHPAHFRATLKQELSCACGARVAFSWMAKRKSPLRCSSSANSEAGPKGEGQDARSKEKATLLGACRARATAPAMPQLGHPCPRQPGKSVSRGRAFRQHIGQPLLRCLNSGIHAVAVCWRKGVDIVSTPLRAYRPRLTASQGVEDQRQQQQQQQRQSKKR
jgi:hypothetical protein